MNPQLFGRLYGHLTGACHRDLRVSVLDGAFVINPADVDITLNVYLGRTCIWSP